jgi:hypothetical protein
VAHEQPNKQQCNIHIYQPFLYIFCILFLLQIAMQANGVCTPLNAGDRTVPCKAQIYLFYD